MAAAGLTEEQLKKVPENNVIYKRRNWILDNVLASLSTGKIMLNGNEIAFESFGFLCDKSQRLFYRQGQTKKAKFVTLTKYFNRVFYWVFLQFVREAL